MVGRLDTVLEAWDREENEESRQNEDGLSNVDDARDRAAEAMVARVVAADKQRSDDALRAWLKEQQDETQCDLVWRPAAR